VGDPEVRAALGWALLSAGGTGLWYARVGRRAPRRTHRRRKRA
jgi:hypothetical protein